MGESNRFLLFFLLLLSWIAIAESDQAVLPPIRRTAPVQTSGVTDRVLGDFTMLDRTFPFSPDVCREAGEKTVAGGKVTSGGVKSDPHETSLSCNGNFTPLAQLTYWNGEASRSTASKDVMEETIDGRPIACYGEFLLTPTAFRFSVKLEPRADLSKGKKIALVKKCYEKYASEISLNASERTVQLLVVRRQP